jgi:hypothetical protein
VEASLCQAIAEALSAFGDVACPARGGRQLEGYWSRVGVPKSGVVVPATASGAARPPSTVFGVRIRPRAQVAWSKMASRTRLETGGQDGSRGSGRHRP